jgi:micrococcal nuclease
VYEYRAYVRKVYDGDTITVDIDLGFNVVLHDQRIRLLKVKAPEVRGKDKEVGLATRDVLRQKIIGKWIRLRTEQDKKGKYGRWLAEVWLDDLCINSWLLSEGLAQEYKK